MMRLAGPKKQWYWNRISVWWYFVL